MKAFVTGATGLVGLNLVERLCAEGWEVFALHRPSSDLQFLSRFSAQLVRGDVRDRESLLAGMPPDVDVVFHAAASTNLWRPANPQQTEINVQGTANLVDVSLERRAKKFVHTSSVLAYAPAEGVHLTEDTPSQAQGHWINYHRTKWESEQVIHRGIKRGLDAVIVNPANILGPFELSNWSRLFKLIKHRKLPGTFPGTVPWCHIKSVVDVHLRAAEVGRTGENYLVGSVQASFTELNAEIVALTKGEAPTRATPRPLLYAAAWLADAASRITRKAPEVTPETVAMTARSYSCDCSKAERELDYREVPLGAMVRDTYTWMVAEGRL